MTLSTCGRIKKMFCEFYYIYNLVSTTKQSKMVSVGEVTNIRTHSREVYINL